MIFASFIIFAVLATASATKKDDDSLLSVLSKDRQEMKELIRHDNKQLREQDTKLQQENDDIRKMNKQLQEQMAKMREEKLQEENNAMKKENKKLQNENAQMKKELKKLRHVDRRQRDQIENLTLEQKIKDILRQSDVALETKKREAQANESSTMRQAVGEPSKAELFQITTTYFLINKAVTWDEAAASCKKLGARLATVPTVELQTRLAELVRVSFPNCGLFWVGSKKTGDATAEWKWVTGDPISNHAAFKWHDEKYKQKTGCLALHTDGNGFCIAWTCPEKISYMCERAS